jgi:hypothetical protein
MNQLVTRWQCCTPIMAAARRKKVTHAWEMAAFGEIHCKSLLKTFISLMLVCKKSIFYKITYGLENFFVKLIYFFSFKGVWFWHACYFVQCVGP